MYPFYLIAIWLIVFNLSFIVGIEFPFQGYLIGILGIVAGLSILVRILQMHTQKKVIGRRDDLSGC